MSEPYLRDSDFTLYNGDALEVLRELPSESVQMCVTSPPYFGLRDYQTGSWEGGDAGCDHLQNNYDRGVLTTQAEGAPNKMSQATADKRRTPYKQTCGKCGARRVDRQIGLEATPEEWVASLVAVFEQVRRVLRKDGTLWVECGDSYGGAPVGSFNGGGFKDKSAQMGTRDMRGVATSGSIDKAKAAGVKPKDLIGQPFLLAFALRDAGWYWRNVLIWHKPNPMPESCRDRFTVAHSYVLLFSKSPRYFMDMESVREDHHPDNRKATTVRQGNGSIQHRDGERWPGAGRNARSVWSIATEPLPFEHYAAFPQALAERCIKAGTSERGCCPECGAPWVRVVEVESSWRSRAENGATRGNLAPQGLVGAGTQRAVHGSAGVSHDLDSRQREVLGWRPSCEHSTSASFAAAPIPCTVLDPFLGSGTTALVARRLGRKCIGIELSERYAAIAAGRTQQLSLEFA